MIELSKGEQHMSYYLHAASYAYGGATKIVLSHDADPLGAPAFDLTANADPEHTLVGVLPVEHFFLDEKKSGNEVIIPLLVAQGIIEPVPDGARLPDGRRAHRLCAGVRPDTDARHSPSPVVLWLPGAVASPAPAGGHSAGAGGGRQRRSGRGGDAYAYGQTQGEAWLASHPQAGRGEYEEAVGQSAATYSREKTRQRHLDGWQSVAAWSFGRDGRRLTPEEARVLGVLLHSPSPLSLSALATLLSLPEETCAAAVAVLIEAGSVEGTGPAGTPLYRSVTPPVPGRSATGAAPAALLWLVTLDSDSQLAVGPSFRLERGRGLYTAPVNRQGRRGQLCVTPQRLQQELLASLATGRDIAEALWPDRYAEAGGEGIAFEDLNAGEGLAEYREGTLVVQGQDILFLESGAGSGRGEPLRLLDEIGILFGGQWRDGLLGFDARLRRPTAFVPGQLHPIGITPERRVRIPLAAPHR